MLPAIVLHIIGVAVHTFRLGGAVNTAIGNERLMQTLKLALPLLIFMSM